MARRGDGRCTALSVWLVGVIVVSLPIPSALAQPGVWQIEVVDSSGSVGEYTSLALDGSGCPHISYFDGTNCDLKYAYREASGWHLETVDALGHVGLHTSLVLDESGHPHISYYGNWNLKYAYCDASGWRPDTADASWGVGWYTSLALDGMDYPHISYFDDTGGDLKYAYRDPSGWHTETVDTTGIVGWFTSLALDGLGTPHISYGDHTRSNLKYAYRDASGWHPETVDSLEPGYVGACTSLALDGSGYPHISYRGNGALKYAHRDGSGWHVEFVDAATMGSLGWYTSLALDGSGAPHISYFAEFGFGFVWCDLRHAYRDASGWHTETVDAAGIVGYWTSLALDGSGYAHISYFDFDNGDLKYARLLPIVLTASLDNGQLVLSWTTVADAGAYWVYGADNEAYFEPGLIFPYPHRLAVLPSGTTTWSSPNGIGDSSHNCTYMVVAADAFQQEMCRSNRCGEFDFGPGTGP